MWESYLPEVDAVLEAIGWGDGAGGEHPPQTPEKP